MPEMERAEAAIRVLDDQLEQLTQLVVEARNRNDYDVGFERLKRWKERTVSWLRSDVHEREAERLADKRKMSFRMGDPLGNLVDEAKMYEGFLKALRQELVEHPSDVFSAPTPVRGAAVAPERTDEPEAGTVFIVHGHDELNLLRLKELIRDRWQLDPLVLSSEPGRGRTIIEKFEQEAQRATFAFVLLTPDDEIEGEAGSYAQARPNVIFELGWFYGRLGRDRVCILYQEGTHIHTDLDGVSRVEFGESVEEAVGSIESELLEAGILKEGGQ